MKKCKKTALLMAVIMCLTTLLTSCGGSVETQGDERFTKATTPDTYPIETDVTLRYWGGLHADIMAAHTSANETELAKYLIEETGINVVYEHPVAGQESASFNIMVNSDELPDIIARQWSSHTGGPQKAIDDGIITPLNDYIDLVSPNLKKILDENPEYKAAIMTDKGDIFEYPMIKGGDKLLTYVTYGIRKDLLDKAGLDLPETLADWEKTLYTFRDMGVEVPLSVRLNNELMALIAPFMGCFRVTGTFFHEDGTVKYGPYEEGFGEWIKLMKKWYDDGILDKDFADVDNKRRSAMVTNGRNGAIEGSVGGNFGTWLAAIKPESGIEYVPVKVPVMNEGDTAFWTQKDWHVRDCVAISATSKHKELAARFLDYGFSEKGAMTYNFGREGISYTMVDGVPTYNPDLRDPEKNGGLSFSQALSEHLRANTGGPFVQDTRYIDQYYALDIQKKAFDMWDSDTLEYKMPPVQLTADEQKTYTDIMTPIDTYREETVAKLISGKMDISKLDEYFAELKRLGIEEAIEIQQAAYDRYAARINK